MVTIKSAALLEFSFSIFQAVVVRSVYCESKAGYIVILNGGGEGERSPSAKEGRERRVAWRRSMEGMGREFLASRYFGVP